jgi:mRNA interferase MazF
VVIDPDELNRLEARSSAQCQHVRSVATTRIERTGTIGPVLLGQIRETDADHGDVRTFEPAKF